MPRLSRSLPSGTIQTVYIQRPAPFRSPSFSIGLTVVPIAMIVGWRSVAPGALRAYESARFSAEGLGFASSLSHADGRLDPGIHSPSTPPEVERVVAAVVEQFGRAGIPWLDHWSDANVVVSQVGDLEAEPPSYGFTQALAASLLEVLPSSSPDVLNVLDQTYLLLSYWRERMAAIDTTGLPPGSFDPGLDDWLLERLGTSAGFLPDRSAWIERGQRLTRTLEQRRLEAQRTFDEALAALGFTTLSAEAGDISEARGKLSRILGPEAFRILDDRLDPGNPSGHR